MKTNELMGAALNWAVAIAEGLTPTLQDVHGYKVVSVKGLMVAAPHAWLVYTPSTDWAQGGPIIEREGIDLYQSTGRICAAMWENILGGGRLIAEAKDCSTPLIAAMRCYVASRLGDEIEIPDALRGD